MTDLAGKKILVVEDEPIVAMMVEDMLADLGALAVGPANCLAGAAQLLHDGGFDAAILDLNLNGEGTEGVAMALRDRGVPFIFATGYDSSGVMNLGESGILQKPYRLEQMAAALARALDER
ncbi:MAG: response regulator [Roseiarcus sp.]|jgi:CheY-like chemotaxis protein